MPEPVSPEAVAAMLNENRDGWGTTNGLHFVRASRDEVACEFEVGPHHLQAYGIVHGGVHAGVIETLASIGAALDAMARGQSVVGLENHTSFVRAVRAGKLCARATPLTRGRRSQLWEGTVTDLAGQLVASGRVRLLCLEAQTEIAGETVTVKPGSPG